MSGDIAGQTILVVEDEPLLGMLLEDVLSDAGATVLGPAATVEQALALIGASEIHAAILDVNLRGVRSDAVASELAERGVPYVFATAYGETHPHEDRAELFAWLVLAPRDVAALIRSRGDAVLRSKVDFLSDKCERAIGLAVGLPP